MFEGMVDGEVRKERGPERLRMGKKSSKVHIMKELSFGWASGEWHFNGD
jgi:hypothetical protein